MARKRRAREASLRQRSIERRTWALARSLERAVRAPFISGPAAADHLVFGAVDGLGDPLGVVPLAGAGTADLVRVVALHHLAPGLLDIRLRGVPLDAENLVGFARDRDSSKLQRLRLLFRPRAGAVGLDHEAREARKDLVLQALRLAKLEERGLL